MGQTLSEPVTEKHTTQGKDGRVMYGASGMQGWRFITKTQPSCAMFGSKPVFWLAMEDAHTTIPEYKDTKTSFFAVFDGHGGSEVAKYSGEHLHHRIMDADAFRQNKVREALIQGYLGIDEDLRADRMPSGCTAVSALITSDNVLYVANVGDSRAVLCVDGHAIALSEDHKPTNDKETKRIQNAGGHVEFGRVNGNLALSRALGDFEFKQRTDLSAEEQAVTADPDVTQHKLTSKDDFIIVACDGIWDCMTNQEAVNFVRAGLSNKKDLGEICETMMDHCLASETGIGGYGCDNMTVIIVALLHGKSSQEWYDAMASGFVKTSAVVAFEGKKEPEGSAQDSAQPAQPNSTDTEPLAAT